MSRIKRLKKSMTQFPDIDAPSLWLLAFEPRAVVGAPSSVTN